MQRKLSNSVKVRYFNREEILLSLKETAQRIKIAFQEVENILLFGSLSGQNANLRSDADILIILKESKENRFFDRIPTYMDSFLNIPISIDILPYTREEIHRMKLNGNLFINRALKEGISLL